MTADIVTESDFTRMVRTVLHNLKVDVLENTSLSVSVEYDDTAEDGLNIVALAKLPALVVTGHSAGGQYAQRYALATDVDLQVETSAIDFGFVVANPSSYAYLDAYRWDQLSAYPDYVFGIPTATDCDSWYNDWKYGLEDIPADHYVLDALDELPDIYQERDVVYLLGDADTEVGDDLDTTCAAMLQGPQRYERGRIFFGYLEDRFTPHAHGLVTVPDVGHSANGMYNSVEGRAAIFW